MERRRCADSASLVDIQPDVSDLADARAFSSFVSVRRKRKRGNPLEKAWGQVPGFLRLPLPAGSLQCYQKFVMYSGNSSRLALGSED